MRRSRHGSSSLSVDRTSRAERSRSRSSSSSSFVRSRSRSSTTSSFLDYISSHRPSKPSPIGSLYRLLMLELNLPHESRTAARSTSNVGTDIKDTSYEQIVNMVKVPFVLESFMVFGLLVCLNSFLTLFTLVPLKICIITYRNVLQLYRSYASSSRIDTSVILQFRCIKRDLITVSLIFLSFCLLSLPTLDISRLYHDVRGQAHIKLYVMFGVLEVADKLLSSIGQDFLNILYQVPIFANSDWAKFSIFYFLSLCYLSLHSYISIYQTVSLNVAANSYSNALLTLLLSNQFSELKSSVFKKAEREGLFQITMSDLTERFQLSLMLGIISLRNLLQLNINHMGLIPNSWSNWNKWIGAILGPGIGVLGSEILVDWLKHCYITKFNRVRPRIYKNFLYVLSLDFLEVFKASPTLNVLHELTDYIVLTKRIGLPLLSLIVCFIRMTFSDLRSIFFLPETSLLVSIVFGMLALSITFSMLLLMRLVLGLIILRWANKIKTDHETSQANIRKMHSDILPEIDPIELSRTPSPIDPLLVMANNTDDSNIEDEDPISPKSPIELSFLPGVPNTEPSTINPNTREHLYNFGESVPPTHEEKRNKELLDKDSSINMGDDEGLGRVMRYEMSSKRIW